MEKLAAQGRHRVPVTGYPPDCACVADSVSGSAPVGAASAEK